MSVVAQLDLVVPVHTRYCPFLALPHSSYFEEVTSEGCGPGSSVGIATDYGLDGPGSNPGGDEIFCPPRPALGRNQPPVKWVQVLSRR